MAGQRGGALIESAFLPSGTPSYSQRAAFLQGPFAPFLSYARTAQAKTETRERYKGGLTWKGVGVGGGRITSGGSKCRHLAYREKGNE
mmetsp:Transcript_49077/g.96766  ORF Transcript_49077/g.96766 Transcript_49077/m.96766 type:complete len:88 (+) Transcript_49077:409-672(+)